LKIDISVLKEKINLKIKNNVASQVDVDNLVKILYREKNFNELLRYLERLKFSSDMEIKSICGLSLYQTGRIEESVSFLKEVYEYEKSEENAKNYIVALRDTQRDTDVTSVIVEGSWDKISGDLCIELGVAQQRLGNVDAALSIFQELRIREPKSPKAYFAIANLAMDQNSFDTAVKLFEALIKTWPDHSIALNNLAVIYKNGGRQEDAVRVLSASLAVKETELAASNIAFASNFLENADQTKACHNQAAKVIEKLANKGSRLSAYVSPVSDTNKVIFMSPDLRRHSVSYFLSPLLKYMSKDFEVHLVCLNQDTDEVTTKLAKSVSYFHNAAKYSDDNLLNLLRDINATYGIDLAGHTAGNKINAFVRRFAQKQIAYLGYPNTTGVVGLDYRITDRYCDPDNAVYGKDYTERLLLMPSSFITYERDIMPEIEVLVENSAIVYGSFNAPAKINPGVLDVWFSILQRRHGSKLIIKNRYSNTKFFQQYIIKVAEKYGVVEQISFIGYAESSHEALKVYNFCDLNLDTFPYSGTTTTCEGLLMGVPTLTIDDGYHRSRVSSSIMKNSDLSSFCVRSKEEYVEFAVNWKVARKRDKDKIRDMFLGGTVSRHAEVANDFGSLLSNL
jgi:predicted O-linked N-acetylglucosamine transferase (SPINDLY family)